MTEPINLTVYFDYLCPFAYRGVRLLTEIEQSRPEVQVSWRHFSLEQVNAIKRGKEAGWMVWEQPLDYRGIYRRQRARALRAFLASHAASLQGERAFARFRLALYSAYHDDEADISEPETLREIARRAELDMAAFQASWQAEAGRERLRIDHLSAEADGAFGVPTVSINGCEPAYFRLAWYPETPAERNSLFDELAHALTQRPYLQELKRVSAAG